MTSKVGAHAHDKRGGACVAMRFALEQQAKRDAPVISIRGAFRTALSGLLRQRHCL
jgi:hypothetical protein